MTAFRRSVGAGMISPLYWRVHPLPPTHSIAGEFEIVTLANGSRSLRSLEHGETFHPVVGPMAEAKGLHVRQQKIVERALSNGDAPFIVWDVGLGAAANALAVAEVLRDAGAGRRQVEMHSFDLNLAPLHFALSQADELGYFAGWEGTVQELLANRKAETPEVSWHLHLGDFRETVHDPAIAPPQAVIFDPYSPKSNPELWNVETFAAIRSRVAEGPACSLTSYSRSTAVRVTLLLAGWFVGRGEATGAKDETTIAASGRELLAAPLDPSWLGRVRRSTAPGPLTAVRGPGRTPPEIADELLKHPQFSGSTATGSGC